MNELPAQLSSTQEMSPLIIFAIATLFATLASLGVNSFLATRKMPPSVYTAIVVSLIATSFAWLVCLLAIEGPVVLTKAYWADDPKFSPIGIIPPLIALNAIASIIASVLALTLYRKILSRWHRGPSQTPS